MLMRNNQRLLAENQLKIAYNVLNGALQHAEADYGPRSTWELGAYNSAKYKNADPAALIIKQYFVPYLKLIKPFGETTTAAKLGYKQGIRFADGSLMAPPETPMTPLLLQNGIVGLPFFDYEIINNEVIPLRLFLYVDINGPKGPNVFNKDVHLYQMLFANGQPFTLGMKNNYTWNRNTGQITLGKDFTIQSAKKFCSQGAPVYGNYTCGTWIFLNGFKIPDDYPLL